MFGATPEDKANSAPFLSFLALILLGELTESFFEGRLVFWMLGDTRYWVNPLQTLLCGGMLVRWWRFYPISVPRRSWFALLIGIAVFVIWIAPQEWFRASGRYRGFDPYFFGTMGVPFYLNLSLRFIRLVVVVPLIEEIFWRSYVLRYVIDPHFTRVPFGTFRWDSFAIVTAGFTLEHSMADWPAAALAGALYNLVAYRTRSLSSCVLAHAATNLLLGLYVMRTGQWGFW